MKKSGSGMVACGNKLFLFGGAGTPTSSGPNQTGAEFIKDKTGESAAGWTNELHMCDLEEGRLEEYARLQNRKITELYVLAWPPKSDDLTG